MKMYLPVTMVQEYGCHALGSFSKVKIGTEGGIVDFEGRDGTFKNC